MTDALGLTSLGKLFTLATAFFGAFLAALWLSLIVWTLRDIRARSPDRLVHILSAVLVAVLNLPGVVIYMILRPPQTLDVQYQATLEEEALLAEVEGHTRCPGCGAVTEQDWQVCARCHTRLRKQCTHCKRLLELSWQICPYCSTPVQGAGNSHTEEPSLETT
ncbi:MAG: zinc ribbon domain-containing protein [Anaerolineales bacterium]|jgi:RNA polymerase subunit RPABC4/transcription elongation factor Spt4